MRQVSYCSKTGMHGSKHVVVTKKRTGIGSDLISVIGAIDYARITNRDVVIDWRRSRYLKNRSANLFGVIFNIPPAIDGVRLILAGKDFDPTCFSPPAELYTNSTFPELDNEMLREPRAIEHSIIVTRPMHNLPDVSLQRDWLRQIRPTSKITSTIESFYQSHLHGRTVVGIHIRHGNGEILGLGREELIARSMDDLVDICIRNLSTLEIPSDFSIFLCTDSLALRQRFLARMDNVIYYNSDIGEENSGAIHVPDRGLAGAQDAVTEMYLLAKCNFLLYTPSWFSHYARIVGDFHYPPVNLDTVSRYLEREHLSYAL